MDRTVLGQTDRVSERFVADITSVRPASTVRPPDVNFQTVGSAELFAAFHALEIPLLFEVGVARGAGVGGV